MLHGAPFQRSGEGSEGGRRRAVRSRLCQRGNHLLQRCAFCFASVHVPVSASKCGSTQLTRFVSFPRQKIQPVDSEYKEGREFVRSDFIKEGSYGEVHTAQDVNTGFTFAVKKVTQSAKIFRRPVSKRRL